MTPKKITGDSIVKVNVRSVNVEIPARIDVRSGRDYGQFIEAVIAEHEATGPIPSKVSTALISANRMPVIIPADFRNQTIISMFSALCRATRHSRR